MRLQLDDLQAKNRTLEEQLRSQNTALQQRGEQLQRERAAREKVRAKGRLRCRLGGQD
jgi:FtsZ-binding cell division protein ZapB